MQKTRTCLVIALALGGAAVGCSSDEPSEYPAPAASVGDEVTPEAAPPETVTPQPEAATSPASEEPPPLMQPSPSPAAPSPAVGTTEPVGESLRDAQIVKIADLVNAGEIEQAKLAKMKAENPRVLKFATTMITQHTKAKQKGMQLSKSASITTEESNVAGELETKGAATLEKLQAADKGATFDSTYMAAQVQQHQEVLELLDAKLIPSATNEKLKAELETTRTMVQKHLTDAKEIQSSLGSN